MDKYSEESSQGRESNQSDSQSLTYSWESESLQSSQSSYYSYESDSQNTYYTSQSDSQSSESE